MFKASWTFSAFIDSCSSYGNDHSGQTASRTSRGVEFSILFPGDKFAVSLCLEQFAKWRFTLLCFDDVFSCVRFLGFF